MSNWRTRTARNAAGEEAPLGYGFDAVVKIIKPEPFPRLDMTSAEEQQRALNREVSVALEVAKLNLTQVVKLYAYTDCEKVPPQSSLSQARYAMVMEHCELGSVRDVMRRLPWRWVGLLGVLMVATQGQAAGRLVVCSFWHQACFEVGADGVDSYRRRTRGMQCSATIVGLW